MSIKAGGRCGTIAPDEKTFAYLQGRPYAPKSGQFDTAVERWSCLASDPEAIFDREHALAAEQIAPIVPWGTSPQPRLAATIHSGFRLLHHGAISS